MGALIGVSALAGYFYLKKLTIFEKLKTSMPTIGGIGVLIIASPNIHSVENFISKYNHHYYGNKVKDQLNSLYYASVEAVEKNANFVGGDFDFSAASIDFDGICSVSQLGTISDKLTGKGILKASTIFIKTKKFEFQGLLYCDGECTIIADEPINEDSFLRRG